MGFSSRLLRTVAQESELESLVLWQLDFDARLFPVYWLEVYTVFRKTYYICLSNISSPLLAQYLRFFA